MSLETGDGIAIKGDGLYALFSCSDSFPGLFDLDGYQFGAFKLVKVRLQRIMGEVERNHQLID